MAELCQQKMKPSFLRSVTTPVVVVLGATGAGKSKLALEVAQKFGGEIISADAMQMYKGLNIVTNKVTEKERRLVKHHMIDFLDPLSKSTIVDFRNMALPIINKLRAENKMPIICGGTNYYIESLIWKILIEDETKSTKAPLSIKKPKLDKSGVMSTRDNDEEQDEPHTKEIHENTEKIISNANSYDNMSNVDLHCELRKVDKERANDLHMNERRKVIRSLEVYNKHNRPHSEILQEQKLQTGGGTLGGPMRFSKNELAVLWVQCDQETLDSRCDKRVDKMINEGMIKELEDFHKSFNEKRAYNDDIPDYTNGIFQSIGFKEFHEYLTYNKTDDKHNKNKLYEKGVQQLKLATRQYARKQVKWMRQRFLHLNRSRPDVFKLDSTNYIDNWENDVYNPAVEIIQAFVDGIQPVYRPMELDEKLSYSHEETRKVFNCSTCNINTKGSIQFEIHLKSRRHSKMVKHLKKTSKLIDTYEHKLRSSNALDNKSN